jgi:preprotein translocase subunit SecD
MRTLISLLTSIAIVAVLFTATIDKPINLGSFFGKNLSINPLTIDLSRIGLDYKKKFETKYGLDIIGGTSLTFSADTSKLAGVDVNEAVAATRDIIEKRINFSGVNEPVIQVKKIDGNYRITVDMPGFSNSEEAIALIGRTAQLSFDEKEELPKEILEQLGSRAAYLNTFTKATGLTGKDVKKATVQYDTTTSEPTVALEFNSEGSKLFAEITKRNIGKQVAISIDGQPITAPVIQAEIAGGIAQITGSFTLESAKQLALSINSGALPVPVTLLSTKVIGPTLGEKEVNASLYAGVIGLMLLSIYMLILYRGFGVVALLSLMFYGLLSLVLFRFIPITLTLSGLSGFILSIGMAVDSNILIFERIKEEERNGKSFKAAVEAGFTRALNAIKDANYTTLLVCFILFNPLNWGFLPQFGLVKGFALTLAVGVLLSLFTGVVVTRRIIRFFFKV